MKKEVTYTISIAVYDNLAETKKCIDGLIESLKDDVSFEIIITDNNSQEAETKKYLDSIECEEDIQEFFSIRVFHSFKNKGFIKAHNRALEDARGEYFLVLNNDIEILTKTSAWIKQMKKEFEDPLVQLVGVAEMCGHLDHKGNGFINRNNNEIDYVEGSCLMIKTSFAKAIGLFDENYIFGYCEDSDLSLRIREMGYKISAIDLPIFHNQYSTGKRVEKQIDLEGYMILNHITLRNRWKHYLMYRNFNYKVLIRREGGWGDVLLITPIIESLKKKNPNLIIDVETLCGDIFINNPYVNKVYTSSHSASYDIVYNLNKAYERRPKMDIVSAYVEECKSNSQLSFPIVAEAKIYLTDEEKQFAKNLLSQTEHTCIVHFDTDDNWVGRTISKAKQIELIDELSKYVRVYVMQGQETSNDCTKNIQVLPTLTTRQLCAIISESSSFVGIDSFPFHIAQSFNKPSVVAFGSIDPEYRVYGEFVVPVRNEWLNCLGCHHYLSSPRVVTTTCNRDMSRNAICMTTLTTDNFIKAFKTIIQ